MGKLNSHSPRYCSLHCGGGGVCGGRGGGSEGGSDGDGDGNDGTN